MVYSAANPEDEVQHTQFHQRFLEGIKYVVRQSSVDCWQSFCMLALSFVLSNRFHKNCCHGKASKAD